MAGNLDLAPDGGDPPIAADQEGRAVDAHVLLAVHALLDPRAIGFDDCPLGVGGEVDAEAVLLAEPGVGGDRVLRYADDGGVGGGEGILQAGEGDRLGRAAGRVVLRIEIEHDLAPRERGEAGVTATVGRQVEGGCGTSEFADFNYSCIDIADRCRVVSVLCRPA